MASVGVHAPPRPLSGLPCAAVILPAHRRPSMAGSCLPQRDGTRARLTRRSSEVRGGGIPICGKDASRLAPELRGLCFVSCFNVATIEAVQAKHSECSNWKLSLSDVERRRGMPPQYLTCGCQELLGRCTLLFGCWW